MYIWIGQWNNWWFLNRGCSVYAGDDHISPPSPIVLAICLFLCEFIWITQTWYILLLFFIKCNQEYELDITTLQINTYPVIIQRRSLFPTSHSKMTRHRGGNTVELKGVSIKSLLELAVLSFLLSSLLCWLLKDSGCYLHSVSGNSIILNKGYSFQKCLSGTARDREIAILVSEEAFQQSVPTLLNTGSWQCCLSFQTQVVQLHTQRWYIQLPPTPLIPNTEFFFLTCTSINQENCAKASGVSTAKAKLQVNGKSSLFEIHSTYRTIFLVQPEEHDFWKGLSPAAFPRDAILHLQSV